MMKKFRGAQITAFMLMCATAALAQTAESPWSTASTSMRAAFESQIAGALIAVAVVCTGLVFAFSEGQGKKQIAGLAFGGSMAMAVGRFMSWLFPA